MARTKQTARKSAGSRPPPKPSLPKVVGRARYDLQNASWISTLATAETPAPVARPYRPKKIVIVSDDGEDMQTVQNPFFRFLDLPPELRNRIYNFVFVPERDKYLSFTGPDSLSVIDSAPANLVSNGSDWYDDNTSLFSILQTCRQIYDEANEIPYTNNYLRFRDGNQLNSFVGNVYERVLSNVRNVEIDLDRAAEAHHCGMLRFFPNLAKVRLAIGQDFYDYYFTRQNIPAVLKVRALGKLKELEVVILSSHGERQGTYDGDAVKLVEMLTPPTDLSK